MVDGSNLATEGRATPSLAQLNEAVRSFKEEHPDYEVIVVVDASFGYRIEEFERLTFEKAEAAGALISPPAGAVGRGDGFLLRIADRTNATVLSNDSFQEFHGEYPWLFDEGRLIGGKPVPGVGWIFTPRGPVRGVRSRTSIRQARQKAASAAEPAEAIAEATVEAMAPAPPKRSRRRRGGDGPPEAANDPLPFITFIAEHPLGSEVEGTVESFSSHGAFVMADGARCYVPVVGLGNPPPRSAKTVLARGEVRKFVVQALDPPRRGIELSLPEVAHVGAPSQETVEAGRAPSRDAARPARSRRTRRTAAAEAAAEPEPAEASVARKRTRKVATPSPASDPQPPEAVPARRTRKRAPAAAEPEPQPSEAVPSRRTRKRAATIAAEPEPVPPPAATTAKRARKRAPAAAEPEPAPTAAKRSRKRVAAPEPAPPPPPEPAPSKRARKKAASVEAPEAPAPAAPAPAKRARKATKTPAPEPAPARARTRKGAVEPRAGTGGRKRSPA